ncbi:MAG: nucleoside deaminase [Eggerthellaceae bacterium]|nr:nucleoside deaminase [Eggerthellaceae bacterium]
MQMAIEQAKCAAAQDEVPIGAVVVYHLRDKATDKFIEPERVLAKAFNLRETLASPSAHAEFLAMQQASEELGSWRLTGCTVYVTLEPCIMCAGLMHQSRIDRCVFGASDPKAGALGTLYRIHADERLNHTFEVTSGVCADECGKLLSDYFSSKRKNKQSDCE